MKQSDNYTVTTKIFSYSSYITTQGTFIKSLTYDQTLVCLHK